MAKIEYIAGIGQEESAQRAGYIKPQPFIPYLSMTKGEMHLALMLEQAQILAGFYGTPKYVEAAQMLENSLYRGVHGSSPYLGAYSPGLQPLAKAIAKFSRETRPASGGVILGRQSMMNGVHVGEIIPVADRLKACTDAAKGLPALQRAAAIAKCQHAAKIEGILNNGLENCGQYLAYGYLPRNSKFPGLALGKIQDQLKAQQDIARVGKFDMSLLQQWLNVGMMRRNADTAKIAPYGWTDTNGYLMQLPEAGVKEVVLILQKARNLTEAQVGAQIAAVLKKYSINGIGEPITIAIAIIGAITALIGSISEFAKKTREEVADAFSQVNGFGSRALGPEKIDWDGDGIPDENPPSTNTDTGTDYTMPLLLVGGALAVYALTK